MKSMDALSLSVSQVNVAWHIDHSLKVINFIYDALKSSDPAAYVGAANSLRTRVFESGKMRRGAGVAPPFLVPPATITLEALEDQLAEARGKLAHFEGLQAQAHFTHFAFGELDRTGALRFIEIHTLHHLAVIRDILLQRER